MRTLESFNVLESFGFGTDGHGLFQEVSEVEMVDVIGGSCGGGSSGGACSYFIMCGCDGLHVSGRF